MLLRTDAARSRSHDPSRPRALKSVGVLAWGARLARGVVVGDVVGGLGSVGGGGGGTRVPGLPAMPWADGAGPPRAAACGQVKETLT